MICGQLDVKGREQDLFPNALRKAVAYLKECDFGSLADGRHDIDGDDMFMMVSEYATVKPACKQAEQHREYIDFQYMVSGKELIGVGFDVGNNSASGEYRPDKDCILYTKVEDEVYVPMKAGMFVILFPEEIHRPGLDFDGETQKVRKAVIKIKKELLG